MSDPSQPNNNNVVLESPHPPLGVPMEEETCALDSMGSISVSVDQPHIQTGTERPESLPAPNNDDAFSSSSDDDEESEGMSNYGQSEWDKAVRTGTQSKGHASDFFAAQQLTVTGSSGSYDDTGSQMESIISLGFDSPPQPSDKTERHEGRKQSPPAESETLITVHSTTSPNAATADNDGRTSLPLSTSSSIVPTHQTTTIRFPRAPATTSSSDVSNGVLPDVLMSMRQKIESLTLFDSDMMKLMAADNYNDDYDDDDPQNTTNKDARESLKRSSQQSISAAVLVSLAHKRYERRRIAAMEIEKVVRALVYQNSNSNNNTNNNELDRVRAILLLLSDDYVRSTSEDGM
jgi:hypothetical protein